MTFLLFIDREDTNEEGLNFRQKNLSSILLVSISI